MVKNIHQTAIIGNDVKMGDNVKIGIYVIIGNNVQLGNNVSIKPFCEIRDNCIVGENTTFGSRCTLADGTLVGRDCQLKYGFVATDTPKIGKKERKPCTLSDGVRCGANVTIMPGVSIGKNSEIGACSQVRHNVLDNEIWYGSPAHFYKKVS